MGATCSHCGRPADDDALFCGGCGFRLEQARQGERKQVTVDGSPLLVAVPR